jgi:hypothetical protein
MQGMFKAREVLAQEVAKQDRAFANAMNLAIGRRTEQLTEPTQDTSTIIKPRQDTALRLVIDNGPKRETPLTLTEPPKPTDEQRIRSAVAATVALVNEMKAKQQRHEPWKRPRVGMFAITDLGAADCRFPVTSEAPHLFCGSVVADGLPYCNGHARLAYPKWKPEYDGQDDMTKSIEECFRVVRERKANGGEGWPKV